MRGLVAIYRRELAGFFFTPLAWVLLFLALLVKGLFFVTFVEGLGGNVDIALSYSYGGSWTFWALAAFLPPLLTMRLISEESRSGVLEFLLTAPVTDAAIVTAKHLAATTVMAVLWSCLLVYALTIESLGTTPDWNAILGGYVGAILVSGLFCGVGVLWSAVFSTPLLAAFFAFLTNLLFLLIPYLGDRFSATWLGGLIERFDVTGHFRHSFLLGIFDTARLVFFLGWTALFVFLAVRVLETRRWR